MYQWRGGMVRMVYPQAKKFQVLLATITQHQRGKRAGSSLETAEWTKADGTLT